MLILFLEACKDTYVRSCTPAPKTPASEVVVKTVTDTLAVTGGEANIAGIVIAVCFGVAAGVLFLYNHFTRKERRDDD